MRFAYPPYAIRQFNWVEAGRVDKALAPHPPTLAREGGCASLIHPAPSVNLIGLKRVGWIRRLRRIHQPFPGRWMRFAYPPCAIRQFNRVEAGRVDKALAPHPPTLAWEGGCASLIHPTPSVNLIGLKRVGWIRRLRRIHQPLPGKVDALCLSTLRHPPISSG